VIHQLLVGLKITPTQDKLLLSKAENNTVDLGILWGDLQQLLIPTWSSDRTVYNGKPLGDAWPLGVLRKEGGKDIGESFMSHPSQFWEILQVENVP
jgi:hypothetical protein